MFWIFTSMGFLPPILSFCNFLFLMSVNEKKKKVISRNLPHLSFFPKKRFKKNEKLKWKWENAGKLCISSLKCTARMLCIQPVSASRLRHIHPTQTSLSVLNFHLTVWIPKTSLPKQSVKQIVWSSLQEELFPNAKGIGS